MPRIRAGIEAAGVLVWAVAIAVIAQDAVFPRTPDGWPSVGVQTLAYLLTLAPVLILRRPRLSLRATPVVGAISIAVLVAATVYAGLTQHVPVESHLRRAVDAITAGVAEETVFRGLVRDRIRVLVRRPLIQVPIVAVLFALYHLPLVLRHGDGSALIAPFVLGLVFGAARELSRGLLLPAALHVAVDLSG